MNGIIIVDKEKNMTSFDVCHKLMRIFNTKRIGHTGTLDPIATGVLVCTVGKYTKLNEVLTSTYKEYVATMKLGVTTDTLDSEGVILKENNVNLTNEEITNAINSFIGTYNQEVPKYSSVKINGKKLYEYARNNIDIDLPKREVDIRYIKDIIFNEDNTITFTCLVSKGTYIRSLIRDIGEYLSVGAIMTDLRRTKQGIFDIKDAYKLSDIENNNYKFLSLKDILDVNIIDVDEYEYKKIKNGVKNDTNGYILYRFNNKDVSLYKDGKMFIYLED